MKRAMPIGAFALALMSGALFQTGARPAPRARSETGQYGHSDSAAAKAKAEAKRERRRQKRLKANHG